MEARTPDAESFGEVCWYWLVEDGGVPDIGVPELLIVALVLVLLFGPGKVADLGGALGKSIREFRNASQQDDDPPSSGEPAQQQARRCAQCASAVTLSQRFCTSCGARIEAEEVTAAR